MSIHSITPNLFLHIVIQLFTWTHALIATRVQFHDHSSCCGTMRVPFSFQRNWNKILNTSGRRGFVSY